ncbi:MAG: hypothetical protein JNM06_20665, partial [Blastocatellia bacterium]|nr:hypothetical protein [Blastocatellia bacterium]
MQKQIILDTEILKLVNFTEKSVTVYYAPKPENMSKGEWTAYPFNPNRLSNRELELINIIDEITHKSGQRTFFRQQWLAKRLGVCLRTVKYLIKKLRCLGIIKIEKTINLQKWINSYTVTAEFSKYKCAADGILRTCTKQDHSECVRPQVDYTCTSCHRFQAG